MKKLIILAVFSILVVAAQAQKFGYLNSAALLEEVPEVKLANTNIQTYQEMLQKQGRAKVEVLQAKYQELGKKEKAGELSPKQLQDEGEKLKKQEEEIGAMEQDMVQKVQQKRETELKPIIDRVNNAIKDIAKEQGYAYIFDTNAGVLLYADEKTDVTAAVKTKLGIATAAPTGK